MGNGLNLTSSVENIASAVITWTKLGSSKNVQDEIRSIFNASGWFSASDWSLESRVG